MIKNKKIYDLVNTYFVNPFTRFNPKLVYPFIVLDDETSKSIEKSHSNLMINCHLFMLKLKFTPNLIWKKEDNFIDVVMQSDLSNIQIVVSEKEKKKFFISYAPSIVLRFYTYSIDEDKSFSFKDQVEDPDTNLLVDLGGFEIIDIYDKVDFKTFSLREIEGLKKTLKNHELQFKHLFFDPTKYPIYLEKDNKLTIQFPSKDSFDWKIIKEEEERDERIPDSPSIL